MKKITLHKPVEQYGYIEMEWHVEDESELEAVIEQYKALPSLEPSTVEYASERQVEWLKGHTALDIRIELEKQTKRPIEKLTKQEASVLISMYIAVEKVRTGHGS